MKKTAAFLRAGLRSDLAESLVDRGYSLSRLKGVSRAELLQFFSETEATQILAAARRRPIAHDVVERLIRECDWRCCLCWHYDHLVPVIIHHIIERAKTRDDSYKNLILLCLEHHGLAHTRSDIARPPCPPKLLRRKKREWIQAIADLKSGKRAAPGRECSGEPVPLLAPPPPSRFIGRSHLRGEVRSRLLRGEALSLLGMGGIGKTSLAQQIAADLASSFPGGIFWGSLADHEGSSPSILRSWLKALGDHIPGDTGAEEFTNRARSGLAQQQARRGQLLMVLDDIREPWLESAKLLRSCLPAGGALLATTRDRVAALALNAAPTELSAMDPVDSLELFASHAGPVSPSAQATAMALVDAVGHLPLAIELLGKRASLLTGKPGADFQTLLDAVEKSALSTLNIRGHRGLAVTFSLTYNELPAPERRLFRYLGVFAGGSIQIRDLAAILELDPVSIEEMIDDLVARALVKWGHTPHTCILHPLLHEYARELLGPATEGTESHQAHARHLRAFLALVQEYNRPHANDHEQLEVVLPDLAAAMEFAAKHSDHHAILSFANALWTDGGLLSTRGHLRLARELLGHAVLAARVLRQRQQEAIHLGHFADVSFLLGNIRDAEFRYTEALWICNEIGDVQSGYCFLGNLGILYSRTGRVDHAIQCHQKALSLARKDGDPRVVADQLGHLGSISRTRDPSKARAYYTEALELRRQLRDRRGEGGLLSNLGLLEFDSGNVAAATDMISTAIEISRETGDRVGEANRCGHLGNISLQIGDFGRANDYFGYAVQVCRRIGHAGFQAAWTGGLGNTCRAQRKPAEAIPFFEEALALSRDLGDPEQEGTWLANLGLAYEDLGLLDRAESHLAAACELLAAVDSHKIASVSASLQRVRAQSDSRTLHEESDA